MHGVNKGLRNNVGLSTGLFETPVGLKVTLSIDTMYRKGIADPTNGVLASIADHKRRQVEKKEIS
jgi:hypothetical protein